MFCETLVGNIETMKLNMNQTDRYVRLIIAVALALVAYFEGVTGIWAYVAIAVAVIFTATAFVRFCPIYAIFGLSTCRT